MTWDGCVTCGQPTKHADWCGWVNEALAARDRAEPEADWWPEWLKTVGWAVSSMRY